MITQMMVQPSSWIEDGIRLQKVRGLNLFKFTDELQERLEILIDRQKSSLLTSAETAELAGITELDRIFTLMNARIIAECRSEAVQRMRGLLKNDCLAPTDEEASAIFEERRIEKFL